MATTTPNPKLTTDDIDAAVAFLRTYCEDDLRELAQVYPDRDWLTVSYRDLTTAPELRDAAQERGLQDVTDWLDADASMVHDLLAEAVQAYPFRADVHLGPVEIRIADLPDHLVYGVDELWKPDPDAWCGVRGQVEKVSDVDRLPTTIVYECRRCGTRTEIDVAPRGQTEPHECSGCERQGPFVARPADSTFIPYQRVRIQQPPEETKGGTGTRIELSLTETLVETVTAGDRATFTGEVQLRKKDTDDDPLLFDSSLDPESVAIEETDFEEIDTSEYTEAIERIAAGEYGTPLEAVVGSIAPGVHGHEYLKQAIALQLAGGRPIEQATSRVRGDIHVLLIGSPGTGKSTLLGAADELAPRSMYASGKGATAAGLTGAAVRDDFGPTEWSVEAGALVLANKGIACVDEIDKMHDDARSSLHGALEKQQIEISKAGINTTLPARTSLLAAGNPKYGRFDPYASESISEQIDLGPALVSRFDLIFCLEDQPDAARDTAIGEHIVDTGRANTGALETDTDDHEPTLAPEVLRAYIAHAKQAYQPRIEDDAVAQDLVDGFVEWRQLNGDSDDAAVPVTYRKLESVRRLAYASARLRLSETVEQQDVDLARDLIMESMQQVGIADADGEFDADKIEAGTTKSQRERIQTLKDIIDDVYAEHDGPAPTGTVLDACEEAGMTREQARHEVETLKQRGQAYEPEAGCLALTEKH